MQDIKIPKEEILAEIETNIRVEIDAELIQLGETERVKEVIWTQEGLTLKLHSPT